MTILDLCWDVGAGVVEGDMLNLSCCILFNLTWNHFLRYVVRILVEESRGTFIWGSICLLWIVTSVLVNMDMHPWSHSCATNINAPDVVCGNTWALVSSFGGEASCRFPPCVYFNTVPFGSWTWRGGGGIFVFYWCVCHYEISSCASVKYSIVWR